MSVEALLKSFVESCSSKEELMQDRILASATRLRDSIIESEPLKKALHDSYGNSLLAIGNNDKVEEFENYQFNNDTLNWWLWLTLYNDSWVFKRVIDMPSRYMVTPGIQLTGNNEQFNKVQTEMRSKRTDFIELLQWGALFGGSIACIMFDNFTDEDYRKPLQIELARKAKSIRFYVVDRWYGVAPSTTLVSDMTSLDYGKPIYYDVTLPDGRTHRLHHSFVLRYEHRTAPKLIKNGQLQGWGYAEGSHILNELSRDDKLKASIQSLIDKSLIEVIKMSGMRGIFMGTDAESQAQLTKRLEMVNWARNFNSLTLLDTEDDYTGHNFGGLGGLSDLLEKNMWQVAAACEMQGILFGDLKGGFANDTEALERFDDVILNRCDTYLRPVYTKYLTLLYKMYGIDEKVSFEFKSTIPDKQTEKQMGAIERLANICSTFVNLGVYEPADVAKTMNSYMNGELKFEFDDKKITELKENITNEAEDIDFGGE